MKVKKCEKVSEPQYPNYRQLSECRTLVGVAAIGFSTIAGLGAATLTASAQTRTAGVPPVCEPRQPGTNAPDQRPTPVRLRGEIAVFPKPQILGGIRAEPPPSPPTPANTNTQAVSPYTVKQGDTLSAIALRLLGDSKRWKEIEQANPGLKADDLKAGQLITIPAALSAKTNEVPRPPGMMMAPRQPAGAEK